MVDPADRARQVVSEVEKPVDELFTRYEKFRIAVATAFIWGAALFFPGGDWDTADELTDTAIKQLGYLER